MLYTLVKSGKVYSFDLNEFENPYVPESVNLLEIARELGFGGTEIWVEEKNN